MLGGFESAVAATYNTHFNTHTLCISLREYICMIRMILWINVDYFP
jgi:hypothetical protein